jgi:hypothetical protein
VEIGRPGHGAKVRKPPHAAPVEIHSEYIRGVTFLAETPPENAFSVRRERGLGIVAGGRSELSHIGTVAAGTEDVHVLVIIPGVTPLLSGGTEFQFGFLLGASFGIQVR